MDETAQFDVAIIGAGPAGLSAALILARCRRRLLLLDDGRPRNRLSTKMHGFITRDGISPAEFLETGRQELLSYEHVVYRNERAESLAEEKRCFRITTAAAEYSARRLLLATGVIDQWPQLEGAAELWGKSVHHCPYCDAWEVRDQPLGVYGRGLPAARLALTLLVWTKAVSVFSDGPAEIPGEARAALDRQGISVHEQPIARLNGKDGRLQSIVLTGAPPVTVNALFFTTERYERLALAESLGCEFNDDGCIRTEKHRTTTVEGVFAAGDVTRDVQFVIMAAGQGAQAATGINLSLLKEDLELAGTAFPE